MLLVENANQGLLVEEPLTKSQSKTRQEAADLTEARMANNTEPTSFTQIYNQAKVDLANRGYGDLMQQELQAFSAKEQSEMLNIVQEGADVEDSLALLEGAQLTDEIYSDVDAKEQMRVVTAKKDRPLPELLEQREAVKQYAYSYVGEMLEEDGFLDTVMNIGGLLAPDETKDFYETFGGVERFDAMSDAFRHMLPEEQLEVLPALLEHIREGYDDNPFDVAYMLGELFGGGGVGGNVGFNAGLDVLSAFDISAIARLTGAYKVVGKTKDASTAAYRNIQASREMRSASSKAQQRQDLGAIEEAAQLQAAAAKSDEVAEAVGTTKMDAARSLDPHSTKGMDDGTSLDGIAAPMGSVLRSNERSFPDTLLLGVTTRISAPTAKLTSTALSDSVSAISRHGSFSGAGTKKTADVVVDATGDVRKVDVQVRSTKLREESALKSGDNTSIREAFDVAVQKELAAARALAEATEETPTGSKLPQAARIQEQMDEALASTDTPVIYNEAEVYSALTRTHEALRKELDQAGQSINTIAPKEVTENGVVWEVRTMDGTYDRTMRFTTDDVNVLAANVDESLLARWGSRFAQGAWSPEMVFRNFAEHLVDSTTYAGQQGAKLKNKLAKVWKETEKGLTAKENRQVNEVLQVGDERGIEAFQIAELRAGIETAGGTYKFSEQQISSYLQKRAYFRKLHSIKDATLRDELVHAGFKMMVSPKKNKDGTWSATTEFAKPYNSITEGLAKVDSRHILVDGKPRSVQSVGKDAAKLEAEGWKLVEFHTAHKVDGAAVRHGLVKSGAKWSDLPSKVLHYQKGYVPRIYRPGYTYVRDMNARGAGVRLVFETRKDAKAYVETATREDPNKKLAVFADGEFTREERLLREADAFGGFITGQRKNTMPTVMKDGTEHALERMSTGDAVNSYLHNIASVVPLNQYRSAAVARWENDVNAILARHNRDVGSKINFRTPDNDIPLPAGVKENLMAQRRYLQEQMGMMTKEESAFRDLMGRITQSMEGISMLERPRNAMLWKLDAHPNDMLKASSFNLMLGMFNLRQIFVQMQNATLAMSMHPQYAPAAIKDALAIRAYMATKDAGAREALLARFSPETQAAMKQFDESGMADSISRQGDLNNHTLGIGHGTVANMRKVIEAGRIPFNEGETMARALAFSIARRKLAAEGKNVSTKYVNEETLRLNMNLQSENAAWWQNAPIINLATQFLQVQAKFAENLLPTMFGGHGKWSAAEKTRVLVGQLALYGVVGVPVAQEAVSWAAGLAGYGSNEEFIRDNPTFVDTINEGFVGMVANLLGAEDADFSSSFSLLAGLDDNVVHDIYKSVALIANGGYTDQGFLETLTGPSANTVRRFANAADIMFTSMGAIAENPEWDVIKGAFWENIDGVAQLTSTWSNARKVMLLQEMGTIQTSSGRVIATEDEVGGINMQTKLAMAMGFKHDVETLAYLNADIIERNKQDMRNIKKDYTRALLNHASSGNWNYLKATEFALFAGMNNAEISKIKEEVFSDIYTSDSKVNKEVRAAIKQILESGGRVETQSAQSMLIEKTNTR